MNSFHAILICVDNSFDNPDVGFILWDMETETGCEVCENCKAEKVCIEVIIKRAYKDGYNTAIYGKSSDAIKCIRCNDNGCPACDGTKGT